MSDNASLNNLYVIELAEHYSFLELERRLRYASYVLNIVGFATLFSTSNRNFKADISNL